MRKEVVEVLFMEHTYMNLKDRLREAEIGRVPRLLKSGYGGDNNGLIE